MSEQPRWMGCPQPCKDHTVCPPGYWQTGSDWGNPMSVTIIPKDECQRQQDEEQQVRFDSRGVPFGYYEKRAADMAEAHRKRLWHDTYNAALTGLMARGSTPVIAHNRATESADLAHGVLMAVQSASDEPPPYPNP